MAIEVTRFVSFVFAALLSAGLAWARPGIAPPPGAWDGQLSVNGVGVPFRFELYAERARARVVFFNGEESVRSTSGTFEAEKLSVEFAHYASRLSAVWADGKLVGTYERPGASYPFSAAPHVPAPKPVGKAPVIDGEWEIGVKSPKGEAAWRFFVRQSGGRVSASILRVDGDTGVLEGSYRDGRFVLSHFSGARPLLLEVTPDGTDALAIVENGKTRYSAVRSARARAQSLPEPADPARWTRVSDPTEPLRFSGRTLDGKREVNQSDPSLAGKVIVLDIMGSWCPNCHDEAPFLAELDRKYRKRGLAVVSLSFEDAEQLKDPTRLRAFVERYGIEYTVLLGGEPAEVKEKLPQAVNLNTWPATFFIGRDGRVRSVHAGFAGKATGEAHQRLKAELTQTVERLLAEPAP